MNPGSRLEINSEPSEADLALVREFVSGRSAAFDRLYERRSAYVYNICLGMLGNPDDARDAMQETFVQLYRSLPRFRGRSKFSTWLHRIAVNKCIDALRGRPRWEQAESLEWVRGSAEPEGDKSLEEQVRLALLKLKPVYRAALVLYYFQQMSYAEIAESLNCSVDLVRVRLHRARKAFRLLYEKGGGKVEV